MKAPTFVKVTLTDVSGKLIKELYSDKLKQGINELTFNKNTLATGIYFVTVKGDNINTSQKIIIE